jgi:hypothetical protein
VSQGPNTKSTSGIFSVGAVGAAGPHVVLEPGGLRALVGWAPRIPEPQTDTATHLQVAYCLLVLSGLLVPMWSSKLGGWGWGASGSGGWAPRLQEANAYPPHPHTHTHTHTQHTAHSTPHSTQHTTTTPHHTQPQHHNTTTHTGHTTHTTTKPQHTTHNTAHNHNSTPHTTTTPHHHSTHDHKTTTHNTQHNTQHTTHEHTAAQSHSTHTTQEEEEEEEWPNLKPWAPTQELAGGHHNPHTQHTAQHKEHNTAPHTANAGMGPPWVKLRHRVGWSRPMGGTKGLGFPLLAQQD